MKNYIKLGLSTLLATGLYPLTASAQSADYASDAVLFGSSDPFQNVGINAGFNMTIPLGAKSSKYDAEKARFGLKFSLTQSNYYTASHPNFKLSGDLLELGFNFDGTPNLRMHGTDIYAPLFGPLYTDETEDGETDSKPETKGNGSTTVALGLLAVGTLGTLVIVNEAADDFSDCFLQFNSKDPKCN